MLKHDAIGMLNKLIIRNLLIVFLLINKSRTDLCSFNVNWNFLIWSFLYQKQLTTYTHQIFKIKNRNIVKKRKTRFKITPNKAKFNRNKFLCSFFTRFSRLSKVRKHFVFRRRNSFAFRRRIAARNLNFLTRLWFQFKRKKNRKRKKRRFDKRRKKWVYFDFKTPAQKKLYSWQYSRFYRRRRKRAFRSLKFYTRRRRGVGLNVRRRRRRVVKFKWTPRRVPELYNRRFEFVLRTTGDSLRLRFEDYLRRLDKIVFEHFPLAKKKPMPIIIKNLVEHTDEILLELKNLTLNIFIKKKRSSYIITLTNGAGEVKYFYSSDRIWAAVKEAALQRANPYLLPENRTSAVVLALFYKVVLFIKKNYKKNWKVDTIFINRLFNTYVIKQIKLMFKRKRLKIKKFVYLRKIPHGKPQKTKKKRRI